MFQPKPDPGMDIHELMARINQRAGSGGAGEAGEGRESRGSRRSTQLKSEHPRNRSVLTKKLSPLRTDSPVPGTSRLA